MVLSNYLEILFSGLYFQWNGVIMLLLIDDEDGSDVRIRYCVWYFIFILFIQFLLEFNEVGSIIVFFYK